jgi:branched-chain amino acid transport system ATP-binding protein
MELLAVNGLRKSFGGITAIKSMDFSVKAGMIVGIIGPNGAGKTTLFNLVTGFLAPDSGSIKFEGTELIGEKPYEIVNLGIARTFQIVRPFLGMSVMDTLRVPSKSSRVERIGISLNEIETRNRQILGQFRLGSKANEIVENLNQGELRLLDIGRALATEPKLLLLDEPFSGLGHENIEILTQLLNMLRDKGITVLIIEHRLRELMKIVDRVMVINFGEKICEGNPAQIVKDRRVIEAYLGEKGTEIGFSKNNRT